MSLSSALLNLGAVAGPVYISRAGKLAKRGTTRVRSADELRPGSAINNTVNAVLAAASESIHLIAIVDPFPTGQKAALLPIGLEASLDAVGVRCQFDKNPLVVPESFDRTNFGPFCRSVPPV
jgi:hypothetical protein